ncbi:50S ribosomal protein L17 [Candidatus Roizmanbacteria bacterium RIFCSPLOWO2_01_FULL_37_12]|uniref:50S ribosomal protein L17 n=1 Tax=Candidatus Roizmanbacteria bacterium RIFCSPLOWO2_01_FULL_37_12 TaxID=1802056 RepID=A0A1F7IBT5_9BACT|nr:MAG: 50S ribosomal protein L17 [Candidatus Roizmanbacteria bacterium RIFCSPHIGHO2_01_FULL_37_16]OGK25990.1 MAG: 50S ribosomal protein L17 [Candidatus Roizmanbacteria bacterium RIFCSPHIGHO2_02_FULL_37_9b]OGK40826.1 MAG: 50S ribosomal protein L17 [Candidatus Roizmanbacteria bacterium RIFCSPLOWO2_01_FULL_37_12]
MLVRKLAKNFIVNAKLETTLKKAKVLKSVIESLVEKSKIETEANKNYLLKHLGDKKLIRQMFKEVGSGFKDRVGGYLRIVRLGIQRADGTETARLEWTRPIVIEEKTPKKTNG